LRHFVELKVIDRTDNAEAILDGLARQVFPLPRLNKTPHDWIGDFLEWCVFQVWKDVLVQLARHTALRRTFLVDDQVMIFPSTRRQTESNDWRLGAGKMTCVMNALVLDKLRQPSFGWGRVNCSLFPIITVCLTLLFWPGTSAR
jgi:hypothetical protein